MAASTQNQAPNGAPEPTRGPAAGKSSGTDPNGWRSQLHHLDGLTLLPIVGKVPADPRTGRPLKGWQAASYTPEEIGKAHASITGAGCRTGADLDGLAAVDIDGATAVEVALEHGCDPAAAGSWTIGRDTDPGRIKVMFTLTPEQSAELQAAAGADHFHHQKETKPGPKGIKEGAELFYGVGQVVVLGRHPTSSGNYTWNSPPVLAEPSPAWFKFMLWLARDGRTRRESSGNGSSAPRSKAGATGWRKLSHCPICGRDAHLICSGSPDGKFVNCLDGQTFSYRTAHGDLRKGQTITGLDQQTWAFCGTKYNEVLGSDCATFKIHEPRPAGEAQPDPTEAFDVEETGVAIRHSKPSAPRKAGLRGLLDSIPDGWQVSEKERPKRSKIKAGDLADIIKRHAPGLARFNDLTRRVEFNGEAIEEDHGATFYVKLQRNGWAISGQPTTDAILDVAYDNRFHPVREYLEAVVTADDIIPVDLDTLSTTYLGTTDPLYDRMLRTTLVGAVARVFDPGCQFDSVCTLKGKQGIRKSSFWRMLASPDWFNCTTPDADKDLVLNIHACWIFELGELESITGKREVGQLRNLITTSTDNIRVPYGKTTAPYPRRSILTGSVNGDVFLNDQEGSRRFWVIECPQDFDRGELINLEEVRRDRDAIWKAAAVAYLNGKAVPCLAPEDQTESNRRNSRYEQEHPWTTQLDRWATSQGSTPFTTTEALVGSGCRSEGQVEKRHEMEASTVLRKLGFQREPNATRSGSGGRGRRWRGVAQPAQPDTTSEREVVSGQKPVIPVDPEGVAQPAQPFSSKRGGAIGDEQEEGGAEKTQGFLAFEVVPAVPGPRSAAAQGRSPAQPPAPEVVSEAQKAPNPNWLEMLWEMAAAYPEDTADELSDRLRSGYRIETTEAEVMSWLASQPPAAEPLPDPWS